MTDETERASLYTRPKSGIALPETGMNTPRMVIALPETGIHTPRMVIALPETGIAPPETGMHTPRMVIAPPEKVIAPPETGMHTPRMVIALPKPVIRTPGTHPLHPATHRHTYILYIPYTSVTSPSANDQTHRITISQLIYTLCSSPHAASA